jgi:hypothetical protein
MRDTTRVRSNKAHYVFFHRCWPFDHRIVLFCNSALKAYRRTKTSKGMSAASISQLDSLSKRNSAASISQLDSLSTLPSDETAAKRSRWTDIETQKLLQLVQQSGTAGISPADWASVATKLGTGRTWRSVETKWRSTSKSQGQKQQQEEQKLFEVDATAEHQENPQSQQFTPKSLGQADTVGHLTDSQFGTWLTCL